MCSDKVIKAYRDVSQLRPTIKTADYVISSKIVHMNLTKKSEVTHKPVQKSPSFTKEVSSQCHKAFNDQGTYFKVPLSGT